MGIVPANTLLYRYPGTKYFESYQRAIFFGREQETLDLIDSIKAYDVFVIFADSGVGKTSLLNAGLIPVMEKENMEPVKFRFQDISKPPLAAIFEQLARYQGGDSLPAFTPEAKLWRMFKRCHFHGRLPVFVFDQFEEFFNHPKPHREACIHELADLASEYLPDYIREEMRKKFREKDPTTGDLKYYTPAHVKLLFLIRADKLKRMDDLSPKIPLILRNRFHLKPLSVKQAEQAIVLPALLPQNGFASPSFNFQEEAITDLCQYLKNEEGEVESFQLQILCQELENRIINRSGKKEKSLWITQADLGGEAGMDNITKNYYNNQLLSIQDKEMRKKAIELIEDNLNVEDRRISLPEEFLIKEGFSKDLLDYLLNTTRLIRVYNDRDSRYFEISHDRLLPSILKSKEQRKEEEYRQSQQLELQRLQEEQKEKSRQLLIEKQTKQRFQWYAITLGLMVIALLLAIFFIYMAAQNEIKTKIETAYFFFEKKEHARADSVLKSQKFFRNLGLPVPDDHKNLADTLETIKQANLKRYHTYMVKGDSLLNLVYPSLTIADSLLEIADTLYVRNALPEIINVSVGGKRLPETFDHAPLIEARRAYEDAFDIKFLPPIEQREKVLIDKLSKTDSIINKAFEQCVNAALVFQHAGYRQHTRAALVKARVLKNSNIVLSPKAQYVLDSLQIVLSK